MMADSRCLLPVCHGGKEKTTFTVNGIKKIISCAKSRGDGELQHKLQNIIDADGDAASIACHKGCYCTYTSKEKIKRVIKSQKRKAEDEGVKTTTRSHTQVVEKGVFEYKRDCIFCGEECLSIDVRHPDRWDRVRECMTTERFDREHNPLPTMKDMLLDVAEQRNDEVARRIKLHLPFVSDLPAAECKYHVRCYNSFMKVPKYADLPTGSADESALKELIEYMNRDRSRMWNSVELHSLYSDLGGKHHRRDMFSKLTDCMSKDIIVVRVDGCASIVGFRETVAKSLKVVTIDDIDERSIASVVRQIKHEARVVKYNSANYDLSEFTQENTIKATSPSLLQLVSELVSDGKVSKKSLSLSQSIQSHVTGTRNQTTLGLAVKLLHQHGSSQLLKLLHEHGFTTSYDEALRFRKSAARLLGDNAQLLHQFMGLCRTAGIIFAWFDNFDLQVFTPNGRRSTHVLSHEFQQPHPAGILEYGRAKPGTSSLIIPRLSKKAAQSKTSSTSSGSLPLQHYTGPTKVNPPAMETTFGISYQETCDRHLRLATAQEKDMKWLNTLNTQENAIEWGGFSNQEARNTHAQKPASTYMFGPLIDAKAAHPDTVLTSLEYLKKSLADMGMSYAHICIDLQLYMVACQIKWNDVNHFKNIILRPGIMHTVQSFCGCIGKLMHGSGIEALITSAFGGLTGIMSGKSWVRAMRAFRMVSTALLSKFLSTGPKTFQELSDYLEMCRQHPTGRHWVDNLIKPTLLVHQLIRSEREGDFLLQQLTLQRMLPYFFVAGHHHYARYITHHVLEMRHLLPPEAKAELMSGAFVCRHQEGGWNSVSSDQFGEQTAIRIGKGGLKGMTLSPEMVEEWINSFPVTAYLSDTMAHIYPNPPVKENEDQAAPSTTKTGPRHKEEGRKRREMDADDRRRILLELSKMSHPLENQSPHLYNIANGRFAPPEAEVNVAESVDIGEKMAAQFQTSLPTGFHAPISSCIKTMEHIKKGMKVGDKTIFELETIFFRLLTVGQQRQIKLATIFQYELCPIPPSLIDEYGCLRKGSKAPLAHKLCIQAQRPSPPDVTIVDASQLLYHIVWPSRGDASHIVKSIKTRLSSLPGKKVLVFDKYHNVSAKDHERMRRAGLGSINYDVTINTPLPSRDAIMRNKHNKLQLSKVLSAYSFGEEVTVESASKGVFNHDEADITMMSYLLKTAQCDTDVIRILSDDTDVFVLLVYWVYRNKIQATVQMERWDGAIWDINATCEQLGHKCLQILGMHHLTGSDTTSYLYGKGKVSALKTLRAGDFPGLYSVLGERDATHAQLMEAGQTFFCALYGQQQGTSMNVARYQIYTKKSGKRIKIMSLPPTEHNLFLHILRAHLQTILAKSADQEAPPELDITKYGWKIKDGTPVPTTSNQPPGPQELMEVVRCSCKAVMKVCSTERCSCHHGKMSCTVYCSCECSDACFNPFKTGEEDQDEEDEERQEDMEDDKETGHLDHVFGTDDEWE